MHRMVQQLTRSAEGVRRLAQNIRQPLMRRVREVDEGPVDPAVESAETDPTKAGDSGLFALVMLLRCHGVGAEVWANSPPVRDGHHRHHRDAALRQGTRAQGASADDKLGAAREHPPTRNRGVTRRKISRSSAKCLRTRSWFRTRRHRTRSDDSRRIRSRLGRPPCADGAPRDSVRPLAPFRHHVVPGGDSQVPPSPRRGIGRLVPPGAYSRSSRRCFSRSSLTRCSCIAA